MEEQKSELFFSGIFPKCPFYKSVQALLIVLALIALDTVGICFLNLWAAVGFLVYSILFYFLAMPLTMCKYCYFKVKETTIDEDTGETIVKLLPLDKWRDSYLQKNVGQKYWTGFMFIMWVAPIVLIGISFFLNFSIFALISLIGFIVVLVGNYFYMLKKKCPKCAIREECHSSF
ncbi:MAG: hypothetical protein JSW14_05285 [Candidatus Bathyarchaeum sp.]|nr:MAG: hypothetical protein JSW14_05285 [Candidatus Bathyarchaeum sp.]